LSLNTLYWRSRNEESLKIGFRQLKWFETQLREAELGRKFIV